ncbi:MAG: protoheme IX farnesyltransferase [Flavobacteriales bacterium]|nr:protoheme IX farnesyltransferase [Flavobacteriales bacterium]
MRKLKYYFQLLKFRLSITVVFSAVAGYFLGTDLFLIEELLYLIFGGLLVTGSANGFNQILERDYDKIMTRTAKRPLPLKNLKLSEAVFFSIIIGFIGLYLLNFIKPEGSYFGYLSKSSLFGLISMLLYVFSYTPLKRLSTISIFVGAIPGAIPFLLGWVAATDNFGLIAGTLFAIQFFWQFPHFISIAWVQDDQYKKAGFKMLFGGKKSTYPALISVTTSLVMMIISIIPFFWKQIDLQLSFEAFVIILIIGIWFTYKSVVLFKKLDDESARKLMLASFLYLPIMQVIYIIDKYI